MLITSKQQKKKVYVIFLDLIISTIIFGFLIFLLSLLPHDKILGNLYSFSRIKSYLFLFIISIILVDMSNLQFKHKADFTLFSRIVFTLTLPLIPLLILIFNKPASFLGYLIFYLGTLFLIKIIFFISPKYESKNPGILLFIFLPVYLCMAFFFVKSGIFLIAYIPIYISVILSSLLTYFITKLLLKREEWITIR